MSLPSPRPPKLTSSSSPLVPHPPPALTASPSIPHPLPSLHPLHPIPLLAAGTDPGAADVRPRTARSALKGSRGLATSPQHRARGNGGLSGQAPPGCSGRAGLWLSCRLRRPDTTFCCGRSWRPPSGPAPRRRPPPPARTWGPTAPPAPRPRSQPRAARHLWRLPMRGSGSWLSR